MEFEHHMRTWDADGNEIPPDLAPGEKEVVAHFHDETIHKAHKRRLTRWILQQKHPDSTALQGSTESYCSKL